MSRQLLNVPTACVEEAMEALVMGDPAVRRLEGYNVIVRASLDGGKVAVVSGGGSGHEPSHGGWVAHGMLSAAVCGSVFASPSTKSILAAIMHVTGAAGCLVIIKNYTGDRLSFGMACEQAKAAGLAVEMVVVGDDCALAGRGSGIAGRRGIAGTCFVHKIAGAAAEGGASLAEVTAAAKAAADALGSMGVALRSCNLPGAPREERIDAGKMEVGLGIHGEPGALTTELVAADEVVAKLVEFIYASGYLSLSPGDQVALLVNNLGNTTGLEMSVVTRAAFKLLEGPKYGLQVARLLSGSFMTALDMAGVSITILKLTDASLTLLDAPTTARLWPRSSLPGRDGVVAAPVLPEVTASTIGGPQLNPADQAALKAAIAAAASAICSAEPRLTAWDEISGDGDCGTTLAAGAKAVLEDLPTYPLASPANVARAVSVSTERSMGGSSGALYSIFLNAVAAALAKAPAITSKAAVDAFAAGVAAISKYGGAGAGQRTMLDALIPAARAMESATDQPLAAVLKVGAEAAVAGAEATKAMQASAGRASYVPFEKMKDVPDPGAMAVSIWFGAAANAS